MASHLSTSEQRASDTGFTEINLPPEFEPLGPWAYFGLSILYAIPVVGLIFLIVFSLSDKNINRRNFSRSYFCILVVTLVILAVLLITGAFANVASDVTNSIESIPNAVNV